MLNDAHCHFFSSGLFRTLGKDAGITGDAAVDLPEKLGWDPPGDDDALADRWIAAMDHDDVGRVMLIASVPGDEASVAAAVKRHPSRFVGAFMINPAAADAEARAGRAFGEFGLRTACLFPAMHHVRVDDEGTEKIFAAAEQHKANVFVHCGVLSVGIRKKLGLPSRFDLRLGDPLAVAAVAVKHPSVPVIIPHFGAGLFREALMAAGAAPNILLDTSSSNSWIKLYPNLTLADVFARALDVVGPSRLLFGTDSSFFPRGWQKPVYFEQRAVLADLGVDSAAQDAIFGGNFSRL
ncbi:MAG TPA: amidohydrolase family protein [Vicinamibacterales bacterium]|nr:amidohydrolase family protein [Vicinamibacterales bacterium]